MMPEAAANHSEEDPTPGVEKGEAVLGELGEIIRTIHSRLRPDGPEVDYAVLYAHVAEVLGNADRRSVTRRPAKAWWNRAHVGMARSFQLDTTNYRR